MRTAIVCVKWGETYGAYYVNTLHDMVRRNLPESSLHTFECFTDDAAGLHPSIVARELPGNLEGLLRFLASRTQQNNSITASGGTAS